MSQNKQLTTSKLQYHDAKSFFRQATEINDNVYLRHTNKFKNNLQALVSKKNRELTTIDKNAQLNGNPFNTMRHKKTVMNRFHRNYDNLSDNASKRYVQDSYATMKKHHNIEQKQLSNIKRQMRSVMTKMKKSAHKSGLEKPKVVPRIVSQTAKKVPYMKDTRVTRTIDNFEIFA